MSSKLGDVLPDATPPPGARERVLAGVPGRIARIERRRARFGYVAIVATAGAAVAIVALLAPARGGGRAERVVETVRVPVPTPVPVVVPLAPPAPAGAPLSPGLLVLPSGSRVVVREDGQVALVRDDASGTLLRVDAGTLVAHVEKRPPGRPFVVEGGEARVEVVGTTFVVERAALGVSVSALEGTVRITSGGASVDVHAGEAWPAGAPLVTLRTDEMKALRFGAPAAPAPTPSTPVAAPGFAEARALEESFDIPGALRAYRALADGRSPEADDALYALGRLQAERGRDPAGASATWAEYRRRFPEGRYARAVDAQVLEQAVAAAEWPRVRAEADAFLAAHRDDPRVPRFLLARAAALAQLGKCPEALLDLRASRSGGPLAAIVRDRCHGAHEPQ